MTTILRRQDAVNAQLAAGYETGENPARSIIHITDVCILASETNNPWYSGIIGTRCGRATLLANTIFAHSKKAEIILHVTCPLCLITVNESYPVQYVYEIQQEVQCTLQDFRTITVTLRNACIKEKNETRSEIIYKILFSANGAEDFGRIARVVDDCILCTLGWQHTQCAPAVHKFFKSGVIITEITMEHLW